MSFLRLIKRHKAWSFVIAFFVIIIGWGAYSMRPKPPTYEYATVQIRDIVQEVSVTGRVKPDLNADLAFETGGRVASVFADVGKAVTAGQTLVSLDNADLLANLQQAQARVDAEQARLDQLRAGTRPEQIAVQKVQLAGAQSAYASAQSGVLSAVQDAYTKTDDAIRNKVDKFFTNPRGNNPMITFYLNDSGLNIALQNGRVDMETMLLSWKSQNDALTSSAIDTNTASVAKSHLLQTRDFLDKIALALSVAVPSTSVTQAIIDGYKSDISISRANINAAISALDSAGGTLSSAKSNVELQTSNLALAEAPAEPETISAQMATVEQMQANVRSLQATISKTILRSPIDGTVTKQDAKKGQIVSPGVPIVSVISKNELQIEAFIPEADIAKVKLNDTASTTLDAYGDTINFPAAVISFDPAETIIEGVATYKTTFRFLTKDDRIKPGMTANIDILTQKKFGVPSLPQRVLIRKGSEVYAQTLESDGKTVKEMAIQTGLRGSDGNTEIVSGLSLGQKVIVPKN